jgi:hypothetical protein
MPSGGDNNPKIQMQKQQVLEPAASVKKKKNGVILDGVIDFSLLVVAAVIGASIARAFF